MLTLQLGTSKVHALAFSPDGTRLAVASGRKLAVVDWRAPAVPVWREPPQYAVGSATTLSFDPVSPGDCGAGKVLVGYQRDNVFHFGQTVEDVTPRYPYGLRGINWQIYPVIVADSPSPRVLLHLGRPSGEASEFLFALPLGGGTPVARLGNRTPGRPFAVAQHGDLPRGAWADNRGRLLVWSEAFLRWYRWPPPRTVSPQAGWLDFPPASIGPPPGPPDSELLAEYPFRRADAVAPLPDGDTVLVASKGAMVRWHAPTGTEFARWRLRGMQALRSLAVSPDGTVAAVGGNGGRVVVWDLDV